MNAELCISAECFLILSHHPPWSSVMVKHSSSARRASLAIPPREATLIGFSTFHRLLGANSSSGPKGIWATTRPTISLLFSTCLVVSHSLVFLCYHNFLVVNIVPTTTHITTVETFNLFLNFWFASFFSIYVSLQFVWSDLQTRRLFFLFYGLVDVSINVYPTHIPTPGLT